MSSRIRKSHDVKPLSLKDAFEIERARRELERRAREDAERRQQEEDLANAQRLHEILAADPAFLASLGLAADRRRYAVNLDHADFRLTAYFEAGKANITLTSKRAAASATPRHQDTVEGVEEALRVTAQFLAAEIR